MIPTPTSTTPKSFHKGLAPFMDGRPHRFVALARCWHEHPARQNKGDKSYYNLLVNDLRIAGQDEIIEGYCWISDNAFSRVMDTSSARARAEVEGCAIEFSAQVGTYSHGKKKGNGQRNYGYCIRDLHNMTVVKEKEGPGKPKGERAPKGLTIPAGWRIHFLNSHTMIVTNEQSPLLVSVSQCPSSGILEAESIDCRFPKEM